MDVLSFTAITVNFVRARIYCALLITWQRAFQLRSSNALTLRRPLLSLSGLTFVIELLEVKCLIDSIVQKRTACIIEITLVYRHLKYVLLWGLDTS